MTFHLDCLCFGAEHDKNFAATGEEINLHHERNRVYVLFKQRLCEGGTMEKMVPSLKVQ